MTPLVVGRDADSNRSTHTRSWLRLGSALLALLLVAIACGGDEGRETVDEITVDWAYYNPVSLVLKDKGWLE